jgi:Predicted SPOUT methyltransferase
MPIKIITVGRRHDTHIAELIGGYEKRLRSPYLIEWLLIPNSSKKGITAREEESQAIQSRINSDNLTILLDERGKIRARLSLLSGEPTVYLKNCAKNHIAYGHYLILCSRINLCGCYSQNSSIEHNVLRRTSHITMYRY